MKPKGTLPAELERVIISAKPRHLQNDFVSDTRGLVLHMLERYRGQDPRDRLQAAIIERFIRDNPNCFERHNLTGHITGSAWLVDSSGTHVLLTQHKKLGKWLQLGGHADGDPNPLEVAIREAKEESGLNDIVPVIPGIFDVDIHTIPARPGEPAHLHYDIRFALRARSSVPIHKSDESIDLAWISLAELERYSNEESLLRMARKWNELHREGNHVYSETNDFRD